MNMLRFPLLAILALCSTLSFAGMRPPVEHETPPPVVTQPSTGSVIEPFSYQDIFFDMLAKNGKMFNYALLGTYLYSDDLFIDVLISVKGRDGEMCYFGVFKTSERQGVVRAATGFQCILLSEGGTGGSAGTGNLKTLSFVSGNLNVLDSITAFPADIRIEYKD